MKRASVLLSVIVTLLVAGSAFADRVIYVDIDAPGANNGSNWENAYSFLQDALADANSSSKPIEVWVAQGIYRPDRSATEPSGSGDRNATFHLIDNVTIKGGFAGYGQTDPNARGIEEYKTVLSGDLDGNDVYVDNAFFLDMESSYFENSLHVVTAGGDGNVFRIDGIAVYGGHGGARAACGGGIWMDSGNLMVTDCRFRNNSAGNGGALWLGGGKVTLVQCTFTSNSAVMNRGGAGIYNSSGTLSVRSCVFRQNVAWVGGGMLNENGGVAQFEETEFTDNSAHDGSAVCNISSSATLSGCVIRHGGSCPIVNRDGSDVIMTNCLSENNFVGFWGSALNNGDSKATIILCTFVENRGGQASIYNYDGATIECHNCIFWDEGYQIWNDEGGDGGVIQHNTIRGGQIRGIWDPHHKLIWGPGNTYADPCFVDPNTSDYHLKSQAGRWDHESGTWVQDNVTSPCIDAGDPRTPIGHEPFPNGAVVNMGAYGASSQASKSYFGEPVCETIIAGDVNGDCKVNFLDFTIMASHWLQSR